MFTPFLSKEPRPIDEPRPKLAGFDVRWIAQEWNPYGAKDFDRVLRVGRDKITCEYQANDHAEDKSTHFRSDSRGTT